LILGIRRRTKDKPKYGERLMKLKKRSSESKSKQTDKANWLDAST
jgi:hypothetical protein